MGMYGNVNNTKGYKKAYLRTVKNNKKNEDSIGNKVWNEWDDLKCPMGPVLMNSGFYACSGCGSCITCPHWGCINSPNYKEKELNLGGKSLDLSDYRDSFEGFVASEDEYIKYMKKCETKRKVRKAIKIGSAILAVGSLVALAITNEDIKKSVEKTAKEIKKICK